MGVKTIKIVVADDHEEMLYLIKEILEVHFKVVATVRNGTELLKAVRKFKPDVIIVDINMPEMNGLEATRKILEEFLEARILLLSAHKDREIVEEAFSAGAMGFVLKFTADEDLLDAVNEIMHGNIYVSPSL